MATVRDSLLEPTRRILAGMHRAQLNRLDAAITDTQDTVTLDFDTKGIVPSTVLAVDDELMYVWSLSGTNQVVVQRGHNGSVAVEHLAGALVEINPRFSQLDVRNEIRNEIRAWHPHLYAVVTKELTVASQKRAADLNASVSKDFFHVLRTVREPRTGRDSWFPVHARAEHDMNTTDFPSGTAVFLDDPVEKAARIRVTYATRFNTDTLDDETDLEEDILLAPSQFDIVPFGVAWRVVSTREVRRTDTEAQGEPRDAQEVPPGHIIQTARQLKNMRDERIRDESIALRHRWGVRK